MAGFAIRWLKRLCVFVLSSALLLMAVSWLLLESNLLNSLRSEFFERLLTEENGYEVVIEGEVAVKLGRNSTVLLSNASIPSDTIEGINLMELQKASFEFDTMGLFRGRPNFEALNIVGLRVNLLRTEDNRISWENASTQKTSLDSGSSADIASDAAIAVDRFLKTKRLINRIVERSQSHRDVSVLFEDRRSGFVFDYRLEETTFDRLENGKRLVLKSSGTVNGVPIEWVSDHHSNGPFSSKATFSGLVFTFEGENYPGWDAGYTGVLNLEVSRIGSLLDVLGLNRTVEGFGAFSARIHDDMGATELSDISSFLEIDDGMRIEIDGAIERLEDFSGVELAGFLRLYPEDQSPPPAQRVSDIRIVDAAARLTGDRNGLVVEDAYIGTNAFDEELDSFGPISVGAVRRTPEGTLALQDLSVVAGPERAPFLILTGAIEDTLRLKNFAIEGVLLSPARRLLADLGEAVARQFGRLEGSFDISDEAGYAQLNDFNLSLFDTDLWELEMSASSVGFDDAFDFQVDARLGISDSKRFLGALSLKEVDFSPFAAHFQTSATAAGLAAQFEIASGNSELATQFDVDVSEELTLVTGSMTSDEISLEDLGNLIAGFSELSKLNLVLQEEPSDLANEIQPLVIDPNESNLQEVLEPEGVQPLVLPADEATATDFVDPDYWLKHTDLDIAIDIAKLSGANGVSKVNSHLVAKQGKARFGPLEVSLGKGYAKFGAAMDVFDAPDVMTVSGVIGGWDLGDLMQTFGVSIEADGAISGNFNLSGRNDSVQSFVRSMRGPVNLNISEGTIATSLLELAGLGVIPWLFSEERRSGQTTIACLVAPLRLQAGRISFDQFVAETRSVQVVAKGRVDWKNDSLDVRAEPRPIGKPLKRSAWPVNISGTLTRPEVEAQVGGSRQRRVDGAATMPRTRKPCVPDIYQLEN